LPASPRATLCQPAFENGKIENRAFEKRIITHVTHQLSLRVATVVVANEAISTFQQDVFFYFTECLRNISD
jgi:hypothetical protein